MIDELQTRPIPGTAKYVVRSDGAIVCLPTGRVLKTHLYRGHPIATLAEGATKRKVKVATVVCQAFSGERPSRGHRVAMRNGNRLDTSAANVHWESYGGNGRWLGRYGTDCHSHRLTEQQAIDALNRMGRGESSTRIGESLGVNPRTIRWLAAGKTWPHLPRPDGLRHRKVRPVLPRIVAKAA